MPIREYRFADGSVEEVIMSGFDPPKWYVINGRKAELIPSAAAIKIEDGTEQFYKITGQRPVEPGTRRETENNRKDRVKAQDVERRVELDKIFPEVLDEAMHSEEFSTTTDVASGPPPIDVMERDTQAHG